MTIHELEIRPSAVPIGWPLVCFGWIQTSVPGGIVFSVPQHDHLGRAGDIVVGDGAFVEAPVNIPSQPQLEALGLINFPLADPPIVVSRREPGDVGDAPGIAAAAEESSPKRQVAVEVNELSFGEDSVNGAKPLLLD